MEEVKQEVAHPLISLIRGNKAKAEIARSTKELQWLWNSKAVSDPSSVGALLECRFQAYTGATRQKTYTADSLRNCSY